jgi:hypothetical protein
MKDSIEERYQSHFHGAHRRVLEIQQRKRKMISDAFNEKKDKKVRETRMADLNLLLAGRRGNNTSGANTTGASRNEAIDNIRFNSL